MKHLTLRSLAWLLAVMLLLSGALAEAPDLGLEALPAEDELLLTDISPEDIDAPAEIGGAELAESEGIVEDDAPAVVSNSRTAAKAAKKLDDEAFAHAVVSMVREYEGTADVYANSAGDYAAARLLVKARGDLPDLSAWNVADMARDKGNLYLIQFYTPDEAKACAKYLKTLPGVKYVEPDRIVLLDGSAASGGDKDFDRANLEQDHLSWGVEAIHADDYAEDLIRRKKTGKVVVAVIDSGVYTDHAMFSGRLVQGYDFVAETNEVRDAHGHGTHVAGTIVDCTWGLNVKIMPVRVMDDNGRGWNSVIMLGIRYAVKHGADVINMSLGGSGVDEAYDEEVLKAVKAGVVVVAAAGNEGRNTKNVDPAHLKRVITVAAVDRDNERPEWSNYGKAVDVCAPGVDILNAGLQKRWNTDTMSGTSMATPHVAAAAALLLCENPKLTPAQVESTLRNTATDIGAEGWDKYFGAGLVNLKSFIQSYAVEYFPNGGQGIPDSQVKLKGKKLTLSKVKPTRSYYVFFDGCNEDGDAWDAFIPTKFTGWNSKADGSGVTYKPGAKYAKNAPLTLYAQWKAIRLNPGLPVPERKGYNFVGWFTEETGGKRVTERTLVKDDLYLYAHWEPAEAE